MDKTDVEILWTLKQSPNNYVTLLDLVKNNDRLTINEELKQKLRFLSEDEMIDSSVIPGLGMGYLIKNKGNELIWKGQHWEQILNLIKLICSETYKGKEISGIIGKSVLEIPKDLKYLKDERKYVDEYDEGIRRCYILSEKGEAHLGERETDGTSYSSTFNIETQYNIGDKYS